MITAQELANFASNRLGNANSRFITRQDRSDYATLETVDFNVDDALIRVTLSQHLSVKFTVAEADLNLDRQSLLDKYGETGLLSFRQNFGILSKSVVVSVPMMERKDPGRTVARSSTGGVHVIASELTLPNNDVEFTLDTLFGTIGI